MLLRRVKQQQLNCALCEYLFPKESLLGTITFRAVYKWRERHGIVMPFQLHGSAIKMTDTAKLCIFCTQFFDKNFDALIEASLQVDKKQVISKVLVESQYCK